jgi:hypothetical protein
VSRPKLQVPSAVPATAIRRVSASKAASQHDSEIANSFPIIRRIVAEDPEPQPEPEPVLRTYVRHTRYQVALLTAARVQAQGGTEVVSEEKRDISRRGSCTPPVIYRRV